MIPDSCFLLKFWLELSIAMLLLIFWFPKFKSCAEFTYPWDALRWPPRVFERLNDEKKWLTFGKRSHPCLICGLSWFSELRWTSCQPLKETLHFFVKRLNLISREWHAKLRLDWCCPFSAGTNKPCCQDSRSMTGVAASIPLISLGFVGKQRIGLDWLTASVMNY